MKLTRACSPWIASLTLGLIGLTGCSNKMNLVYDPYIAKVALNPMQGDKLTWTGTSNSFAQFVLVSPCSEGLNTSTCSVSAKGGTYLYRCSGCQDPEVVVGSDAASVLKTASFQLKGTVSAQIAMACQSNAVVVDPNSVQAAVGATLEWVAVGDPALSNWTNNLNICTTAVTQASPVCTIANGTAPNTYQYTITAGNCNPGNGSVTVQ